MLKTQLGLAFANAGIHQEGPRGTVLDMGLHTGLRTVDVKVPLAELFGYATALRSLTRGRANFVSEPSHFAQVPKTTQDEILKKV